MERTLDTRDDAVLLRLIATQRDADAFSELFGRYKRPGFSLAFSILSDSKAAEEVVQEAMIRVWSSAGKFRDDGADANPKGWIMKIIARESSRALQQRKRRSKEIRQNIDRPSPVADDQLASGELIQALRGKVAELAEEDRHLIALHFGGGLSQTEISETLSVSQQTISLRIQRLLKELRSGLAASGFTCATAGLAVSLESALSSGYAPSSGLHAKVMARVNARPSVRKARKRPPTSTSYAGYAAVVALVVAGVVGLSLWSGRSPAAAPVVALPPANTPVAVPVSAPSVIAPQSYQSYHWTFENGPAPDLVPSMGLPGLETWKWDPEKKAMVVENRGAVVFAGVKLPSVPVCITIRGEDAQPGTTMELGMRTFSGDSLRSEQKNWRKSSLIHVRTDAKRLAQCYFFGRYSVEFCDGAAMRVLEYDKDSTNFQLALVLKNLVIRQIDLEPLTPEQLPPELKNIEKLTEGMVRIDQLSKEEVEKLGNE